MALRIKICGITREEDAWAAVDAGADALGFVFVPGTPRFIEPGRAAAITRHLLGLVSHTHGAREYRRLLSEGAREREAGPELIRRAAELAA